MHGLSGDELKQIAKIRIKNYEFKKKEDLITSLLNQNKA